MRFSVAARNWILARTAITEQTVGQSDEKMAEHKWTWQECGDRTIHLGSISIKEMAFQYKLPRRNTNSSSPHQTLIFISMRLCGSYPTTLKSSGLKSSMSLTCLPISSLGKDLGRRVSCSRSPSTWSL